MWVDIFVKLFIELIFIQAFEKLLSILMINSYQDLGMDFWDLIK